MYQEHQKWYYNAGVCDEGQKFKAIIEPSTVSTPEGITDNSKVSVAT